MASSFPGSPELEQLVEAAFVVLFEACIEVRRVPEIESVWALIDDIRRTVPYTREDALATLNAKDRSAPLAFVLLYAGVAKNGDGYCFEYDDLATLARERRSIECSVDRAMSILLARPL